MVVAQLVVLHSRFPTWKRGTRVAELCEAWYSCTRHPTRLDEDILFLV
jgi:hypothetical protein